MPTIALHLTLNISETVTGSKGPPMRKWEMGRHMGYQMVT